MSFWFADGNFLLFLRRGEGREPEGEGEEEGRRKGGDEEGEGKVTVISSYKAVVLSD